ncbi:unnamed protein product [Candidula unifasciata]|uniref:Carboxylic ester hydrolase n=1 Tax=Candidula unifasciata TaxID=100452 RepID=A0A8S3ZPY9_9EUPU|nr:unnamed protein product [Candidula unifasciata]
MQALICLAFFILGCCSCQGRDDTRSTVIVSLEDNQQLKGFHVRSTTGDHVYKFYGIPYALPPTRDRRFKPPVPAGDWVGVKEALTRSHICPQSSSYDSTNSSQSEDCLYLNVFSPDVNASLPVFVWIHGGGLRVGSAFNDGDVAVFAARGVVAVSINYRLGALGFLSTGDDTMPGNYGMLDQVLALRWVQKYIQAFGGDPSQVTIGGESAGSVSVSLLIVSPTAKGLFQGAICESGSASAVALMQGIGPASLVRDSTLRPAASLGCNQTSSLEILKCLQNVDVKDLINTTQDSIITPRIETTFGFLPDFPPNLLTGGNYNKVDTLQGANSGDVIPPYDDAENYGVTREVIEDNIRVRLGTFIDSEDVLQDFADSYIGNETDPIMLRDILMRVIVDIDFMGGTLYETNKFVTESNTGTKHYLYQFDYQMSGTPGPVWQGVAHTAELPFVFYPDSRYHYTSADDRAVGESVQTMWVNFVKYGDPTPTNIPQTSNTEPDLVKWEVFTENNLNMFIIDSVSELVAYPRLFLIPLYEKCLEIAIGRTKSTTVVG